MAELSAQFDVQSGVALNALASVTKEQILQAINQIAPLGNIGGVVYLSSAGNTAITNPGVSNNSRFSRYLWLDSYTNPPTLRAYDTALASWESIGLGDDAVDASHIAVAAVSLYDDAIGTTKKVSLFLDDSPNGAWAGRAVRVDSAGKRLEAVAIATLLANGTVPVESLVPGTDNYILRMQGSTPVWENVDFAASLADGSVSLSKIDAAGASAGFLVRVSATDTLETMSNDDSVSNFIAARSIAPNKLKGGAGAGYNAGDILRFDGLDWQVVTPPLGFTSSAAISTDGIVGTAVLNPAAGIYTETIAHSLGDIPKLVRVVWQAQSSGDGYNQWDELELHNIVSENYNPIFSVTCDDSNIYIKSYNTTKRIMDRSSGALAEFDSSQFLAKAYAWL